MNQQLQLVVQEFFDIKSKIGSTYTNDDDILLLMLNYYHTYPSDYPNINYDKFVRLVDDSNLKITEPNFQEVIDTLGDTTLTKILILLNLSNVKDPSKSSPVRSIPTLPSRSSSPTRTTYDSDDRDGHYEEAGGGQGLAWVSRSGAPDPRYRRGPLQQWEKDIISGEKCSN